MMRKGAERSETHIGVGTTVTLSVPDHAGRWPRTKSLTREHVTLSSVTYKVLKEEGTGTRTRRRGS